jgi:RNA polymerase sigma-70 factor, ECF subfamily
MVAINLQLHLSVSAEFHRRTRTTTLLRSAPAHGSDGDDAIEELVPLIYDELRAMAHRQLAGEWGRLTLETTELVHEAYLRLVDEVQVTQRGRAYFFAAAARAMRRVLIDRARRRSASKRGSGQSPESLFTLDEAYIAVDAFAAELLDLDEALDRLAAIDPRQARVVECRYFAGLSVEETAEALGVSPRTVKSEWAVARAWLYDALRERDAD